MAKEKSESLNINNKAAEKENDIGKKNGEINMEKIKNNDDETKQGSISLKSFNFGKNAKNSTISDEIEKKKLREIRFGKDLSTTNDAKDVLLFFF